MGILFSNDPPLELRLDGKGEKARRQGGREKGEEEELRRGGKKMEAFPRAPRRVKMRLSGLPHHASYELCKYFT